MNSTQTLLGLELEKQNLSKKIKRLFSKLFNRNRNESRYWNFKEQRSIQQITDENQTRAIMFRDRLGVM